MASDTVKIGVMIKDNVLLTCTMAYLGIHWNSNGEAIPVITHKIYFDAEIAKYFHLIIPLSLDMLFV